MSVLYVKEQGSCIQKRSERIVVTKGQMTLLANVENIAIIGNVQITTQALHMLLLQGIDVNFFTFSGKYIGQTASDVSKNIFLRFSQYELYNQLEKRILIAKKIVENKVKNQIYVIKKHRYRDDYDWHRDVKSMEIMLEELHEKQTPNEVLGVEGYCSNIYFSAFAHMFQCEFEFNGRNRRPPKDPINVLISLGYTFLTKEVSSALDAESFEMYLGFLHGIRYGRKSLPLDIVEEFRQPVIDRFVITLCNKSMINKYDFEQEEERIILNESGFQKFCREYEKYISGAGGINYRSLIRKQVQNLKAAVMEKREYIPYRMEENHVSGEL